MTKGSYAYKQQRARLNQLLSIPMSEWAGIHCALNKFEYPKQLDHKPKWWDKKRIDDRKYLIIDPLMKIIHWAIGEKVIMDEWNKALKKDEREGYFKSRLKDEIKKLV